MRHLTRRPFTLRGCEVFSLVDNDGLSVEPFDEFVKVLLNREFAAATVKRYMEVVANFLDYLIEAKVFGVAAEWRDINRAVEAYLQIRVRANRIRASNSSQDPFLSWAKPIVENLGLKSVQANENLAAPINLFLRLSETIARTELERAA